MDDKTRELIALGAAVAANCHPCVKYHLSKARTLNLSDQDIQDALEIGRRVRTGAADEMDSLIQEIG